jgi:hypothetical protein
MGRACREKKIRCSFFVTTPRQKCLSKDSAELDVKVIEAVRGSLPRLLKTRRRFSKFDSISLRVHQRLHREAA